MEKLASRKLRIGAKETMQLAESLYTKGYISYPRTETNTFPPDLKLQPLVEAQLRDSRWSGRVGCLVVGFRLINQRRDLVIILPFVGLFPSLGT